MGVNDLHKDFLGRDTHDKDEEGVPKHSLNDLEAESVVAVDVMSSLYKALKSVPAANAFDTRRPTHASHTCAHITHYRLHFTVSSYRSGNSRYIKNN